MAKHKVDLAAIGESLKISVNRQMQIIANIGRMIKDYRNNPLNIYKEISLNLRGNDKYFAMFIIGNYFSEAFSTMDHEEQKILLADIMDSQKFSDDTASEIGDYLKNFINKALKEEKRTIDIIKMVIDSNFGDKERSYIIFLFGLVL